jgi:succinate dehydrogenase/fumarate reductase flavoprotein subunit
VVKSPVLPEGVDAAREASMRLAEKIRSRSIRADVKAADEVKRLGLIATATCRATPERTEGRGHP